MARVLAHYLWETGQVAQSDLGLPRRMKDLVSRAVTGQVLSARTLGIFVDAFAMPPADADELRDLHGRGARRVPPRPPSVEDTPPGSVNGAAGAGVGDPGRSFRTIALHELHTLGPDGAPALHRTVHVIRAVRQLGSYPYLLDAGADRLQVVRGGRAGRKYRVGRHEAIDIEFHRPLRAGETGSFEYLCGFRHATTPATSFRRGGRDRLENVELHVRFHPDRLPERLWWAVWPGDDSTRPIAQEPVALDPDGMAHRFLEAIDGRAVGFRWRFPAGEAADRAAQAPLSTGTGGAGGRPVNNHS